MPALRRLTRSTQVDATGRLGEDLARAERLLQEARGTSCRSRVGVGGCGGERMEGDRRNSVDDAVGGGDRRNSVLADEVESHSLVYLAALPPAARTNSLRSLGASLCEEEIGLLVAALRRSRMNDEVEVVLRSAESAGLDTVKVALVVLECSWG